MKQNSIEKVYPLTPMQEGMLYHSVLDPASSAYFTQLELRFNGCLDINLLQKSIDQLVEQNDILRTVFVHQQLERPRQVVFSERQSPIHYENLSDMDGESQQRYLQEYKRNTQAKGFDLSKDLLFKVAVFQLSEEAYQLIWSNHHILIDGWSLGILMKKLLQYYEAFHNGITPPQEPVRPYANYINWLKKKDKEEALDYWKKRLDDFEEATFLPKWNRKTEMEGYQNETFTFVWDEELVRAIQEAANHYQVTEPNFFQAIWGALLSRYSNTNDVVFGTVVSGRPSAISGIENMVGLFINTIPVRIQFDTNATFADLFRDVQRKALEAEPYDYVPLYEIQNRTPLNQELISHLLAFENFPLDQELNGEHFEERLGFSVEEAGNYEQTNYDFNLIVFPGEQWTIKVMFDGAVYDKKSIEKTADHLTNLAKAAVSHPETEVSNVSFISEEEKGEQLQAGSLLEVEYPENMTIPELFEKQAERAANRMAVAYKDEKLTYRELNEKANRLARRLQNSGVGPDVIVGIMSERSAEMIVSILAVLKAGGAYLPIDPSYPDSRIKYMLDDSKTRILLAQSTLGGRVDFTGEVISLDQVDLKNGEASNLELNLSPDHLSYIIYTSGTTGNPKGVMISHRNVVRLLFNEKMPFSFSERDAWTMFHSFCFDFSVWEMYGALLYGGKLVVVPKAVTQSPSDFRELLIREKITVLNQTPSAFATLIQREMNAAEKQLDLRYVVFGGEKLKPLMLKDWHKRYPDTKLINMYGITETTVHVTFKEMHEEDILNNISNIGTPLPTLGCCILDKSLNLVPAGVVGEMCVSGLGVAKGYLHRPELTAEKFIDHPYKPGERLYRSGDLARLLPNGELEYFGRMDQQVKVRGFRIELGEIEHQLMKLKPISDAAVLPVLDHKGNQVLCAYFTAEEELGSSQLRKELQVNLPDYMVPNHYCPLPEMPLTANGKLDRKALPELEADTSEENFQEPRNDLEEQLAEIWQDLLGINRIGIDDDFFSLGGHSLKAMMLTAKIHQKFEKEVSIQVLFEQPTIRQLADFLKGGETHKREDIERAPLQSHYPVSASQKRMYILTELEGRGVSYNIPSALLLEGEVDKGRLEAAFQALLDRHEILRTSFEMVEGKLVQKVNDQVKFRIESQQASEADVDRLIKDFIRPFDLNRAPLVRVKLVQLSGDRHLLLIDMHHIISDGVSTGILINDLGSLYEGEELPKAKLHYKDFAFWQNSTDRKEQMKEMSSFWLKTFSGDLPSLDLPTDKIRPDKQSFHGDRVTFHMNRKLTGRIHRLIDETGTTLYMFLMATFQVYLSKLSSQEEIIVGSPVAGRTHSDIKNIPGLFVNTLAIRSKPEARKTFKQFLNEVKETCLKAYENQDYPFEELVDQLPLDRQTNRHPLFNVMFNLQNEDTTELQLGDLKVSSYSGLPLPAKFDLTLEAVEREEEVELHLDYATDLYTRQTIQRWSGYFLQILNSLGTEPDLPLAEIELLSHEERSELIEKSMGQPSVFLPEQTLQQRFEERVQHVPDQIAVAYEGQVLTYKELDKKANQLARNLREHGIGREEPVALVLNRSVNMIVSIMAVLKAGGAYVPIDPDNPEDRKRYILEDSGAKQVITEKFHVEDFSDFYKGNVVNLDDANAFSYSSEKLDPVNHGGDLAYMIYTSGTTGKPKGVLIEHRQVQHLVEGITQKVYSHYPAPLNVALVAPFYFDASVVQIFSSLLLSHALFIVPKELAGGRLCSYYQTHRIDVTDGTPAHLQMLTASPNVTRTSLRHMLIGGEALPQETAAGFLELFKSSETAPRITNVYGPTETCVEASTFEIDLESVLGDRPYVPIGQPLGNNRLYILDDSGKMLPNGVSGELYVAGDGVGRGYKNLPELTADKFLRDPFVPGEMMYRTGDLARRAEDGNLEFMGRIDDQIKLRGYRIEPGEIEKVILMHEKIDQTLVAGIKEKNAVQELCAYFTADAVLPVSELKQWLSSRLPNYMVPFYLIQLDAFPLKSNGKIDRSALPEPEISLRKTSTYIPPQTEIEKELCRIWEDILGVEPIGLEDDFFELGGHSLRAMTLIGIIQKKWQRALPLKILFDHPTIGQLSQYLSQSNANEQQAFESIPEAEPRDYYPLSSAQNRIYILENLNDTGTSYNMPTALQLDGELDIYHLEQVFKSLIQRHESLRTSFAEIQDLPVQEVHDHVNFSLKVTNGKEEDSDELIQRFIRPFDLQTAPLFRVELIRFSDRRHLLLIDMHHIIGDGVSSEILIQQFMQLYRGEKLPQVRHHYKDYALWQQRNSQQERIREQEKFWLNQFAGDLPELHLPLDYPRPAVQSFDGGRVSFEIENETASRINKILEKSGTTLHMFMLAAFNILLAKLSNQRDIVVGTPVAGRRHPELKDIPGMFVNTLALRNDPEPDMAFSQFLQEVKSSSIHALENQDYPFDELVSRLNLPRDMSRNPLFNVMMTLENSSKSFEMEGLKISPHEIQECKAKFDLLLAVFEGKEKLGLQFEYSSELFSRESIGRWSGYFLNIVRQIAEVPENQLSRISLMDPEEESKILEDWNRTEMNVPGDKMIHELFEEQVLATPEKKAVVYQNRQFTYRELNQRANGLAARLLEKGIKADERVAIMAKPSVEMAVGVLAILKAGGAFVPIDPEYPEERISFILSDCGASVFLTQSHLKIPADYEGEVILLDRENDWAANQDNPQTPARASDLAYVIYTSGTTGKPKGVMIEHHSLVNLCFWHNDSFNVDANDRSAKFAGFGFDASVWELFPYLIAGAEVHMIDESLRTDIIRLNDYFEENRITITFLPTQLCEQFIELDNDSLRILLTGGDKLKRSARCRYTIVNNYGPTEGTVVATSTPIQLNDEKLPIGKPIANTKVYILGDGNQLQPVGIAGELCISGRGLARGYMNLPEKTTDSFVSDPFFPGERMYRTGDLARWLDDGTIEYIGRIDQQVKIRGFRIELSEVEAHLAEHSLVKEAAVNAIEDSNGNKFLCAYVVGQDDLSTDLLQENLAEHLPEYMIPQHWIQLESLPLTPNGKVDKRSLPRPNVETRKGEYEEPETETEEMLAQTWKDILGTDKVGIQDNFFSLGGDSIKAIQIASRLHKQGWKLEVKDLFQNPTIKKLSPFLKSIDRKRVDQAPVEGKVKLTPIQKWFFGHRFTNQHHWNQSVMLHAPYGFDQTLVKKALDKILLHHDALRMTFEEKENEIIAFNHSDDQMEANVEIIDLHGENEIEKRITEDAQRIQGSLDLSRGPLMKTVIFQTEQEDHLLIVIHHLVVDGVSWRILLEDFSSGYRQAEQGESIVLQEKTDAFKDWANELVNYGNSDTFLKQADYWQAVETEDIKPIPKDNDAAESKLEDAATLSFEMTEEETSQILTKVHVPYRTEINDLLLCALGLSISEWTKESKVCMNMEGHGREEVIPGLNIGRTVGWFTAQYPVVLEMSPDNNLPMLIKAIKERLRSIPDKGMGYGILRYLTDSQYHRENFSLKPEISFNYLGQVDREVKTDFFGPSPYPMGDQINRESESLYPLNFNGMVRNNRLVVSCTFNKQEYLRPTIESLMDRFHQHLLRIIQHCMNKKDTDFTPSDFNANDLQIEEMGDLFDVLEEKLN